MEILVMTAQLLLGLSILVGVHELGHLVTAKIFGMRVDQYSIGFPPKLFGIKYGETEYSVGAIPLGGYVKIAGMVDESLDTEKLNEPPKEWEFRAKPAWQRLIVMMGGIVVNVITGIIIFVVMVYSFGENYIPKEEVMEHGIVAHDLGQEIGLQTGDKIIAVNGKDYSKFSDLTSHSVLLGDNSYFTVKRNGETKEIKIPNDFIEKFSSRNAAGNFIDIRRPFEVGRILPGSNAEKAGLKPGDKIVEVNGEPVTYFYEFSDLLQKHKGKNISMTVKGEEGTRQLNAQVDPEGKLGFAVNPLINVASMQYSFMEAIPKGTGQAFGVVWVNIKGFGKIFSGEVSASKSISGPIGIAQIFGGNWDWYRFWRITGLLSMVLAFMNFLPIPALDGGHVMFLLFEIISGKKPSEAFLEGAQKVGMVLLLSLMAFAIFNDIFKTIF